MADYESSDTLRSHIDSIHTMNREDNPFKQKYDYDYSHPDHHVLPERDATKWIKMSEDD